MNERNKKMELLGSAPIPKALLAMGLPTMIGMMINALYNLVDAYFVGGLGTGQMGAISVAFPLGQVVVGLGLLFGNGAASYIARLLGNREKEKASKVANTALYSSIFVGAVMIICTMIFLNPILKLLGATESILPYAVTYSSINEAIKTSVIWTTIFCVILGSVLILFPTAIISQFTKGDTELIHVGQKALRANGFSFMLFGFYTVYSSLFLALGKAKEGCFLGVCRQGLYFIPVILIAPMIWEMNGILYAQPIADVIAAIITAFMSIRLHQELTATKLYSVSTVNEHSDPTLN